MIFDDSQQTSTVDDKLTLLGHQSLACNSSPLAATRPQEPSCAPEDCACAP